MKKKEKNLLIDNIPPELKEDVIEFCKLNNIEEIDSLLLSCLKGGFAIEKYGVTPVKPGIIEKEVEKEVEKIIEVMVEVPVEKIVEAEKIVEVEKIVEDKEKTITENLTTKSNQNLAKKELEIKELKKKIKEYEGVLNHFQRFSNNKTTHLKSSRLDDVYGD